MTAEELESCTTLVALTGRTIDDCKKGFRLARKNADVAYEILSSGKPMPSDAEIAELEAHVAN